jgi:hypothetical protein
MTSDVYSGDDALRGDGRSHQPEGIATFDIVADAHADLLLRVSVVLNLLNIIPRRMDLESHADGLAHVHARVDCEGARAELIARKLRQLTAVRDVKLRYDASQAPID